MIIYYCRQTLYHGRKLPLAITSNYIIYTLLRPDFCSLPIRKFLFYSRCHFFVLDKLVFPIIFINWEKNDNVKIISLPSRRLKTNKFSLNFRTCKLNNSYPQIIKSKQLTIHKQINIKLKIINNYCIIWTNAYNNYINNNFINN